MLKCVDCFFKLLPPAWVPNPPGVKDGFGNEGRYKTKEEQSVEQHVALAKSEDAVAVYHGEAVCLEHLVYRRYNH